MNAQPDEMSGGQSGRHLVAFTGGGAQPLRHSIEAEEHLLSCLMLDGPDVMLRCQQARITEKSFYLDRHGIIFGILHGLFRQQKPMEAAIVAEELKSAKQLDAVGGYEFLVQISGRMTTTAQAGYFIEQVRDLAAMRATVRRSDQLKSEVGALTGGGRELAEKLELHAAWVAAALDQLRCNDVSMQAAAQAALERTLAKMEGRADTSRQLLTGLREFDRLFGAFDPLEEDLLIGIGAATSNGKSSLSRQFADAFMANGRKGIVFLLETTRGKWLELATASTARINARQLEQLPRDLKEKFERELRARHAWVGERLFIFDESMKAEMLCARVEDHARRFGRPDFVIVDHLHELSAATNFRGNRMQELSHIARLLKRTALRLGVPFFVPMQLNRAPSKDGGDRRPTKHDIRDCGEIENACDKILLIHTPKTNRWGTEQNENDLRVMVELICAKSRNGRIGFREFWFERQFTRFVDIDDRELDARAKAPIPTAPAHGERPSRAKYLGNG